MAFLGEAGKQFSNVLLECLDVQRVGGLRGEQGVYRERAHGNHHPLWLPKLESERPGHRAYRDTQGDAFHTKQSTHSRSGTCSSQSPACTFSGTSHCTTTKMVMEQAASSGADVLRQWFSSQIHRMSLPGVLEKLPALKLHAVRFPMD